MAAVLDDALHQHRRLARAHTLRAARRRAELDAWFASDDLGYPFSFANVCRTLGIDTAAIREALQPAVPPPAFAGAAISAGAFAGLA